MLALFFIACLILSRFSESLSILSLFVWWFNASSHQVQNSILFIYSVNCPRDILENNGLVPKAKVRTGHGTTDWFQIGKGVHQGCILSPCLFNLYAVYIMWNAGLMKQKLESRLPRDISITSDMQMTPSLCQKAKKSLLMKVKGESEKVGLKLNI